MDNAPPWYYDRALKIPIYRRYHLNRARAVCRVVSKRPAVLLDIGCDGGTLTKLITECLEAERAIGFDIKEASIEYAKETKPGIEFYVADAENIPLRDGSVDVATLIEVLEHVENPERVLIEVYRVLRDNGVAVIMVPDSSSILFRVVWKLWTITLGRAWRDAHVTDYNEEKLIELVRKTGFRVKYVGRVNMRMLILIVASKLDVKTGAWSQKHSNTSPN